ncbi:hypothetical protein [Vulcanisaeta sp. JCM 14467]|uniref:hypothetical protein n=1 Tax=Vulcanisaeta sp. JCM 14467 TaxID=1295370 RepID=UPI000ADA9429|nr:hypothetical protein [Vulcanisaeta sp. JCM 14467]
MNELLSVVDTVLRNYIKSSFMIYTAYLRLVMNSNVKFLGIGSTLGVGLGFMVMMAW